MPLGDTVQGATYFKGNPKLGVEVWGALGGAGGHWAIKLKGICKNRGAVKTGENLGVFVFIGFLKKKCKFKKKYKLFCEMMYLQGRKGFVTWQPLT